MQVQSRLELFHVVDVEKIIRMAILLQSDGEYLPFGAERDTLLRLWMNAHCP
jgi:hypothetical protein